MRRKLIVVTAIIALVPAAPFIAVAVLGRVLGPQLRAHVLAKLHAVAPDTALGSEVDIGLGGRVTLGPVDMEWPKGSLVRHLQIAELTVTPVLASFMSGTPRIAAIRARGIIVELERDPGGSRPADTTSATGSVLESIAPLLRNPLDVRATDIYARSLTPVQRDAAPGLGSPAVLPRFDEVEITVASLEASSACHAACTGTAHLTFASGGELTASVQSETNIAATPVIGDQLIAATVNLIAVPTATLPSGLTEHLVHDRGRIDASIAADVHFVSSRVATVEAQVGASAQHLTIDSARIDPAPLALGAVNVGAGIVYRASDGQITVDKAFVGLGDDPRVRLHFDGAIATAQPRMMTLHARTDHMPFDALLESLPSALRPGIGKPRLHGELDAWTDIKGPLTDPMSWQLTGDVDVRAACGDKPTGAEDLRGPFVHHVVDDLGVMHDIAVDPQNEQFVALESLPEHVVRAITTAEDGGFFGHHGFDFVEIQNSIVAVTSKGRSVRGGSTLTQQLAKNLYLTSAKTYSRKAREALIALALEGTLSKQRLLEIYVNIIEWGPGLYGLGPAAQRYFAKRPGELTAKEAAYLASIIPNPVRYYGYYAKGEVSETFQQRVNDILEKLHATGVLDDAAYAHAVEQPMAFAGR